MNIDNLSCDICGYQEGYSINPIHEHQELELGGVPVDIWTPQYFIANVKDLKVDDTKNGINRYSRLIPLHLDERVVSFEGNTPLVRVDNFYLKDETENPTRSFKDRGIAALVSEAVNNGIRQIAIPSTGNAAISLGYYGNRAGIETIVFIPADTSIEKVRKIKEHSEVIVDPDLIESYEHFFRFCKNNQNIHNGFPANNVAYIQGLKTTAYEVFSQLGNVVPDHLVVPVGSGGNIVGLYYGFQDLMQMGLSNKMPHFVSVQLSGADPITQGFIRNQTGKLLVIDSLPKTKAGAIASDTCFNYFKILNILSKTDGVAISVTEDEIDGSPECNLEYSSRSVFPAFRRLQMESSELGKVVLLGTGSNK